MDVPIKTYKPSELAKLFELHSNTVRLYESIGFISKADRAANGYRQYTEKHILQLKIIRHIFAYPFTNHQIRVQGTKVIKTLAEGNLILGNQEAKAYIECIHKELEKAKSAARLLMNWAEQKKEEDIAKNYTRKELAQLLEVTTETIRNWERNDLIKAYKRGANQEVLFQSEVLERAQIIYMLRQTGHSMSAIYRCMAMYDRGKVEGVQEVLDTLNQDELMSAGDCWMRQLKEIKLGAEKIPALIEAIKQLEN